jgi:hypothetical protein
MSTTASLLPIMKQIKCPKSPVSIDPWSGINELEARLTETSGYTIGNLFTGSGNKNDDKLCDRNGYGCGSVFSPTYKPGERVLGNNYFFQSGKCPSSSSSSPACAGKDRYIYTRNIPTSGLKGNVSALVQDSMDMVNLTGIYKQATAGCAETTLPVGSRIYDTKPFQNRQDFLNKSAACVRQCESANNDDNAFANCAKDCKSGWWPEKQCAPKLTTTRSFTLRDNNVYQIPVSALYETFSSTTTTSTFYLFLVMVVFVLCLVLSKIYFSSNTR